MVTTIIWWSGNALLCALLLRALTQKIFTRYPVFYSYIAFVFTTSLLKYYVFTRRPASYPRVFWSAEFLAMLFGFGLTWKVCRKALASFPGVHRVARILVLAACAMFLSNLLANLLTGAVWGSASNTAEVARTVRAAQAVLLVLIAGLLTCYHIPLGRNVRGIILGYGFFIGASLTNFTFCSYLGSDFQQRWPHVQPYGYLVALLIWCATLWSYHPNPLPQSDVRQNYDGLSGRTVKGLDRVRHYLLRTVRI
jgi:hypothetical protein